MKRFNFLTLIAMMLFAGNVLAIDLSGTWTADNQCVPGNDPDEPLTPKAEITKITIEQNGIFFETDNGSGENCYGVISGKSISMTCPGTLFYGEFNPPKTIVGINHKPDPEDSATCSVVAIKQ